MQSENTELKVGAFALTVILVLTYMTFQTGGIRITGEEGYSLFVNLEDSAGIDLNTKVRVAGVEAGHVATIGLAGRQARLRLSMDPGVKIHEDAEISVRSMGFLGDKYLALTAGSDDTRILADGDEITRSQTTIAFDQLATRMTVAADSLSSLADSLNATVGGGEMREDLLATVKNVRALSEELRVVLDRQDSKLAAVLGQIQELTAALKEIAQENRESVRKTADNLADVSDLLRTRSPELFDELERTAEALRNTAEATRDPVLRGVGNLENTSQKLSETAESLMDVVKKVQRGEGTLGKLVTDDKLYNAVTNAAEGLNNTLDIARRFRTFVEFRGEYLEQTDAKGYFTVTLKPREDKYYLLGIVSDQEGRVDTKTTVIRTDEGETSVTEDTIESNIEFTAQFAWRFSELVFRIGVTESTFGTGADFFLLDDKLRLSADIWDFGRDEPESDEAHLKLGMDYAPVRYLFVSVGYDNVLNANRRGFFLGGGIRFEDEDLKYLFGTASSLLP